MKSKKQSNLSIKRIEEVIEKNLGLVVQTLVAGLDALDSEGNPDWSARVTCAKILLNKKIPDLKSLTVNGKIDFEEWHIGDKYDVKRADTKR